MIWLYLWLATFTPDSQITKRELLIPFPSSEACEAALRGIVQTTGSIGAQSDSGACVTISNEEEFAKLKRPWPDTKSYDEKIAAEADKLVKLREEAERFKREYNAR